AGGADGHWQCEAVVAHAGAVDVDVACCGRGCRVDDVPGGGLECHVQDSHVFERDDRDLDVGIAQLKGDLCFMAGGEGAGGVEDDACVGHSGEDLQEVLG